MMPERSHDQFGKIVRSSCEHDQHDLQSIANSEHGDELAKCTRCGAVRETLARGEVFMPATSARTERIASLIRRRS